MPENPYESPVQETSSLMARQPIWRRWWFLILVAALLFLGGIRAYRVVRRSAMDAESQRLLQQIEAMKTGYQRTGTD